MMKKLNDENKRQIVALVLNALGGEAQVQVADTLIVVSCLVAKKVIGEIRVEFSDFEKGFWEIRQSITLWNSRVSAHEVTTLAQVLVDVGERVRYAEAQVDEYMRRVPNSRVSSCFKPIVL